jgi:hypothetical protein
MPRKQLYQREMPAWLQQIENLDALPIDDLLEDSIYYPASAYDYSVIEAFSGYGHSFIYVDPDISKETLLKKVPINFHGYYVYASREVKREELCFREYKIIYPDLTIDEDPSSYSRVRAVSENPYAVWIIFQRQDTANPGIGPKRLSFLFIAGEGVATYQALYFSNKKKPSVIVMQAFVWGNWTGFDKHGGFFNRVVISNPAGRPDYLSCQDLNGEEIKWDGYKRRVESKKFLPLWISDDLPLGDHYIHKPGKEEGY